MLHFTLTTTRLSGHYGPMSRGKGTLRLREVCGNSNNLSGRELMFLAYQVGTSFPLPSLTRVSLPAVARDLYLGNELGLLPRDNPWGGLSWGFPSSQRPQSLAKPQHLPIWACPIILHWKQLLKR